jgi:hypothetical protein
LRSVHRFGYNIAGFSGSEGGTDEARSGSEAGASYGVDRRGALIAAAAGLARRGGETLLRWVAAAVVLAGVAKLDYVIVPPLGPENVHLGDVLRVAAWSLLLVGVVGEMRAHSASASRRRSNASAAACARVARRCRAGPGLHSPSRQAPGRVAGRRGDHRGHQPCAGGLPAGDRGARPAHPRAAARGPGAPRARLAAECGLAVQVNVRVATEVRDEVRA